MLFQESMRCESLHPDQAAVTAVPGNHCEVENILLGLFSSCSIGMQERSLYFENCTQVLA